MDKIKVGDRVRDKITGFQGILIGRTQWLHGCDTVGIKPEKLHDGKPIEAVWFDVLRLEIVETKITEEVPDGQGVG